MNGKGIRWLRILAAVSMGLLLTASSCLRDWTGTITGEVEFSAERTLQDAIQGVGNLSEDWKSVVEDSRDKLIKAGQSTIANEVSTALTRASAAAASEVKCVADFARDRVRQDLQRILDRLQNRTPAPIRPVFCSIVPPEGVDANLVPDRIWTLQYYGYDLDKTSIAAYMETTAGRMDVTRYLDFPTHYHMTLNLGAGGVQITSDSKRFIFAWDGQDQSSVAILPRTPPQQPEVTPTYLISVRTWDVGSGAASETGKVKVQFIGSRGNSDQTEVPGDFRRGEVESASFVRDDLGEIGSVVVTYDDGRDNNAWALDWVEITNMQAGRVWRCPGPAWLGHQNPQTKTLNCSPR